MEKKIKKKHQILNFFKSLDPIELWNFKVNFIFHYHLHKLQYFIYNNYVIIKHTSRSNYIWKHVFHGQVHLRAELSALPFSYCFGIM